jgi:membrane associated rhomboid family serine protease
VDVEDVPKPLRIACAILALEALGLLGVTGFLVFSTLTGHPGSVARALLGAAFALLGAIALAAGARSLLRLNPAARTPIVVIQLLAVPVSYSLAFQAGRVGYGGPIFVAALSVIYLLFTPPVRAALDREPPA